MSSTIATSEPARSRSGLSHDLRTGQLVVIGVLLALAAVAWVATDLRMAGMDAGPGTDPGALGFYITTWTVMMAAMMLPSIAPMVLAYRNLSAQGVLRVARGRLEQPHCSSPATSRSGPCPACWPTRF